MIVRSSFQQPRISKSHVVAALLLEKRGRRPEGIGSNVNRLAFFSGLLLLASGCAAMGGSHDQYYVCSYDIVWNATLDTLKAYSITLQDKETGTVETAWIEMEGTARGFGAFGREGFGNRERARFTAKVTRQADVSSVSLLEIRQRWHARGGVTQQATRWWPVDPSEEALADVTTRLNTKLLEKGCPVS